jgi:hypothetical protein
MPKRRGYTRWIKLPELLIGCGNSRAKVMSIPGRNEWTGLVTLDQMSDCGADIVHDLNELPYPIASNRFHEIHAYDVLEHCGKQGDWRYFFAQWSEFHRILAPGGLFFGICPKADSPWAWGDPSHTRIISRECLTFLSQEAYRANVGTNAMSDFRSVYKADFRVVYASDYPGGRHSFVLEAIKEI